MLLLLLLFDDDIGIILAGESFLIMAGIEQVVDEVGMQPEALVPPLLPM